MPKENKREAKKTLGRVCTICMEIMRSPIGSLDCGHDEFCFGCIAKWSEVCSKCPLCMSEFKSIQNKSSNKALKVDTKNLLVIDESYCDVICEICGSESNEDKMLLCDDCDCGYHTFCIGLSKIPNLESWYCHFCIKNQGVSVQCLQKLEMNNAKHCYSHSRFARNYRNNAREIAVRKSLRPKIPQNHIF